MNQILQRTQHLFIVRIWCEIDNVTALSHWRGVVVHQTTQESHYFTRLQDLLDYIGKESGMEKSQALL